MDRIRCSVVMATYNGEKYLCEQLDSILKNLKSNDEIVISDDESNDNTINIIKQYQQKDKRIKLICGPKLGVKKNFENAINNCKGNYIFLCDQDDVWMPNKIDVVLKAFEKYNCDVVVHNANIVDFNLNNNGLDFFNYRRSGKGILKNIYRNTYIGCCMAFKKEIKDTIIPIPNNIEMHDQWIGIIGEKYGKSVFINDCLINYRRHGNNVSSFQHYPVLKMIKNRVLFCLAFIRR